jgi:asparagine synthase (glutamine-hydrolysing)
MVEDKLSMAHSLETRVPFLDNDLVDFAMSLPVKHKLANLSQTERLNENVIGKKPQQYFNQTHDGKLLLRKALAQYMPDRIVKGKKQGFSSPDNCWFKGDSIEFIKRHLTDKKRSVFNFLDHGYVQQKLTAHLNGQQNNRLFIWSVLNFEYWCQSNGF